MESGSGVCEVMLDHNDLRVGEFIAEAELSGTFVLVGERARDGDAIDFGRIQVRRMQGSFKGLLREVGRTIRSRYFALFDGGDQAAILQDAASSVVPETAETKDGGKHDRSDLAEPVDHAAFSDADKDSESAGTHRLTGKRGAAAVDEETRFDALFFGNPAEVGLDA